MYDSVSPSDPSIPAAGDALRAVRADSEVRAVFGANEAGTHIERVFERGSLRLRFPRGAGCEAVLINTGGGITGGDRIAIDLSLAQTSAAVVTSQAAEKIYRTDGPPAVISMHARLASDAHLDWLPQETILFNGAAVQRTLDIELASTASLTLLESLVLGRIAHGEHLTQAHWHDRWRIRRADRLIFAENVRLDGAISDTMQRPAIGAGARALATLLHVAPDAERKLDDVRAALASASSTCAASAWDGILVVRFAGLEPQSIRRDCISAATVIRGVPMPRAWSC